MSCSKVFRDVPSHGRLASAVWIAGLWLAMASALPLIGCGPKSASPTSKSYDEASPVNQTTGEGTMIEVTSKAFADGAAIPRRYTDDGEDLSPPLKWSGGPENTKSWALICDDPDAPRAEPWVHWVIYNIPADVSGLEEGIPPVEKPDKPTGAVQGRNSWGTIGYRGPAPPRGSGPHHYHFRVYALDAELDLKPGLDKKALLRALNDHIVGQGELVGIYER